MVAIKDVLGMNARSQHFLVFNKKESRRLADSKLLTKEFLAKYDLPHPKILGILTSVKEVEEFSWLGLDQGFVIKPVEGLGGQGIMVIKKPAKYAGEWLLMDGRRVTVGELKLHARDIIEGQYSRNNLPDRALIEERVKIHPKFAKIAVGGTPDVRVVMFNKIPVMAMLRVPTEESQGKSNLHQGAIGLGVDIATGITTYGVWHDEPIEYFPVTKRKVNGIRVPFWNQVLRVASKVQFKRPGLNYVGVDILLDKDRGPMIIELNDQPGLSIQIANRIGLKRRLQRVEDLKVESSAKAVRVAQTLFASTLAKKVKHLGVEKPVLGIFETVRIKPYKGKRVEMMVKIDTGAYGSSVDKELAEELGLLRPDNILWQKGYRSALGTEERQVIMVDLKLRGRRLRVKAGVTERYGLRARMIIGRRDLRQFLINPGWFKPRDRFGKRIKK